MHRVLHAVQRRGLTLLALVLFTSGITAVVAAPPASASTLLTNVSVTVTTDMCPSGGAVKRVNVTITTPGSSGSNWGGDTVGGLAAFYGNDLIQGSNFCQTSWFGAGYYWYWQVTRWFSFSGQHTYV